MILDPLHPELARLDQMYQQTCASFDNGELSSAEARSRILNLSYTDSEGRIWRVDTKRSGRHAAFTDEIADVLPSAPTPPASAELAHLNQIYQQTCASFDNGELSSAEARSRILNLSYTDPVGRIWRIDTKRSGRHAAFTDEIADQIKQATEYIHDVPPSAPTPPASVDHAVTRPTAAPMRRGVLQVSEFRRQQVTSRRVRTQIAAKSAAVLIMFAAIVVLVLNEDSPAATIPPATPVTTTQASISPPIANITSFGTTGEVPFDVDIEFGRSVHEVPLLIHRRGVPDGTSILVIGVIHGDEDAGMAVMDLLRTMELTEKVDLWLVPTMNPDGQVARIRQNANGVDLNRNFSTRWNPVGSLGYWQYSGPSPGSEPEVQAMERLGNFIKPEIVIWYHQDYFRISPSSGREGAIRERYASLVQLPLLTIAGGTYSGTGTMWSKSLQGPNGISLTVEFGPSPLRPGEALWNANAVMTIVREFFQNS